ncbi:MAG: hypothetical protein AAFX04_08190 [Pseudomonadota bacterium]
MAMVHIFLARLALLATLLSVLVPVGFMPDWGEQGFVISICSPRDAQIATIMPEDPIFARLAEVQRRMQDDAPLDKDNRHDDTMPDCTFSGAAALAVLGDGFAPLTIPLPDRQPLPGRKNLGGFLSETLLPPATGPPLFSTLY